MRTLLAIALAAASSWAMAAPPPGLPPGRPRPATIRVTGQAQVSEPPDRVYIDIGVTTQARKSEAAAAENAARLSAVMAAVKRAAGAGAQLTTTEYSVSPDYSYPPHGTATITGYTASNVLQVRLDDLRRIGAVLDGATQAGSNEVRDIRFALRDEDIPRAEALRKAALNARQDAQALADALGLRVVRVLSVAEQGPEALPAPRIYMQARQFAGGVAAPSTPVAAGTLSVNASVTLTVEVAPATR